MKENKKEKELFKIMIGTIENIFSTINKKIENSEYVKSIGAIYKRSIEESNRLLRFKERFRKRIDYGVVWCENCTSMEVIWERRY